MSQGSEDITKVLISFIEDIAEQKLISKMEELKKQILSDKPFLTLDDVIKVTGLCRSTIYSYVNEKKLSYYKPTGKNLFFKWDDVKNFIMSSKHYYKDNRTLNMEADTMIVIDKIK